MLKYFRLQTLKSTTLNDILRFYYLPVLGLGRSHPAYSVAISTHRFITTLYDGRLSTGISHHNGRRAHDRRGHVHHRGGHDGPQWPAQWHPSWSSQRARPTHVRRDRHQRRLDQRHPIHIGPVMRSVRLSVLLVLQNPTVETRR